MYMYPSLSLSLSLFPHSQLQEASGFLGNVNDKVRIHAVDSMIRPFCDSDYLIKNYLTLLVLVFVFTLQVETMKVYPAAKKRNVAIREALASSRSSSSSSGSPMEGNSRKRLRRLPHVFGKVLELPFHSDADVSVEETSDCLRFVAETDDAIGKNVRAHAVEIHPGVTKIVVRSGGNDGVVPLSLGYLQVDMWRYRLPGTTRPELASAAFVDGDLIVTVPKGEELAGRDLLGGPTQLVLVQ